MALVTLILIILMNKFLKGMLGNLSILLGLVLGTVIASVIGMTDFTMFKEAGWFSLNLPFHFGTPKFEASAIISLILVVLVIMTEATGNIIAIHEMVGKDLDDKNLARGLRTDGLATMLASIFNTFPHTAFAQNIGLVALTGVKSRFVVAISGGILILLGLFPKMAALFTCIPYPVLGGAGFVMFGMVISGGIKTLKSVEFDGNKNSLIVAVSIGLSMIPTVVPTFYQNFPEWVNTLFHSGITTGSLCAILLNLLFNILGEKKEYLVQTDYSKEV